MESRIYAQFVISASLTSQQKIETRVRYGYRKVYMFLNFLVSSGFKSPSKATHYEWLDTTRTTFRIGKLLLNTRKAKDHKARIGTVATPPSTATTTTSACPSDFDFLTTIGKGSFGRVFQVRHKETGKFYAMKVLSKEHIRKKNEVKHVMAELSVLKANIHHPFLVSLHFSFQNKDKLYFVLDHLNGGELFSHLQKEKHFSESRSRFYAAEIASALGYLHQNNIIYRDLKPENLLLDKHGYLVLTDFGLCKEGMTPKAVTGTFCGTPEYLAPEIILKKPYDISVDWWCLGSVLYEMLFGLPPFYSKDHNEMYNRIVNEPLKMKHAISAASSDIIIGLLQKDKTKRLGSKSDFKDIKEHPFFMPIDWEKLLRREVKAPFIPRIESDSDVRHISKDFTETKFNPASLAPQNMASTHRDHDFENFTFVEKNLVN
uniref:Serine/threonine-protein kinase Sgk1 n=1 Tax=Heterorhabditis bacteriophora TaxID=37862 RepID=A0A1I7XMI4_HETBA